MDKFVVRRSSAAVSQPSPNINETNFDKNKLKRPVENASNTETVPSKIAKTTEIDQDSSPFNMDVGLFSCGNVQIDDHLRLNVIQNSSVPTSNFEYPYSVHVKNGKEGKRFLRENHFKNYPWLAYSISKEGLFCKICVLFKESNLGGKHKTENLKTLVTTPLKKFSKLLGKDGFLEVHQNNLYHKYALQRADQFKSTILNPEKNILNLVNADRLKKITENRERLKPIIQSIMFLGKQNIPLRGHRDDGALFANDNHHKMKNEGNFRELLRYRVKSGDKILEQHLLTTHSKATYISSNVQNQLIDCFKEEIQSEIIKEIKENRFYRIMFDETTDLSHVSQMSLVLRYVVNDKIKENFIEFIDCHQEAYSKLDSSENIEPKLKEKQYDWIRDAFDAGATNTNLTTFEKEQLIEVSCDLTTNNFNSGTTFLGFWIRVGKEQKELYVAPLSNFS